MTQSRCAGPVILLCAVLAIAACARPGPRTRTRPPRRHETERQLEQRLGAARAAAVRAEDQRVLAVAESLLRADPSQAARALDGLSDRADPVAAWTLLLAARQRGVAQVLPLPDITALRSSPDGRLLATGHRDGKIKIWDTDTLRADGTILVGHRQAISAIAFSPDGRILVTASAQSTFRTHRGPEPELRFWDLARRRTLGPPIRPPEEIYELAFSPDGRHVASAWGAVRFWDVTTRRVVGAALEPKGCMGISALLFSPDGKSIATACSGDEYNTEEVRLWDVATRRPRGDMLRGHGYNIRALAFSPDGKRLAVAADELALWGVARRRRVPLPPMDGSSSLRTLAFSPDGKQLAGGDSSGDIHLWSDEWRQEGVLRGHRDVSAVTFLPDGKRLVSLGLDGTVRVWSLPEPEPPGRRWSTTSEKQPYLCFSPDGRWLAALGGNTENGIDSSELHLFPLEGAPSQRVAREPVSSWGRRPAFTADSKLVATASGPDVLLWSTAELRVVARLAGGRSPVTAIAFAGDGRRAATSAYDGTVRLWDLRTLQPVGALATSQGGPVRALAFSPDGDVLASVRDDGGVDLWNTRTGRRLRELPTNRLDDAIFDGSGRLLFGASSTSVQLWSASSGQLLRIIEHRQPSLGRLGLTRDGSRLLADDAGHVAFRDPRDLQRVGAALEHSGIADAALAPTGRWLALSHHLPWRLSEAPPRYDIHIWSLAALKIADLRGAIKPLHWVRERPPE